MDAPANLRTDYRSRNYWIFQAAFWSPLALPDFLTFPLRRNKLDFFWAIGDRLAIFIASHVAHRLAQRQRWFYLPPRKMILRLASLALLLGALYFAIGLPEKFYQGGNVGRLFHDPGIFIGYWMGCLLIGCSWTGCYMAFNEWHFCRGLELDRLRLMSAHQEMQLENLKSQLNPHFLFNSLNTLRELITEDTAEAQQAITQLSTLLRYSLKSRGTETASFAEELAAVEAYIGIEKTRFEERLRVRWEVDDRVRTLRVPPMLLQTLVENAVKHGVARLPEGGEIIVRAQERGNLLHLEVLNTGDLEMISAGTGIGLRNAHERLQLLYGMNAHCMLENTADGYVRVLVTLPVEHNVGATT